MSGARDTHDSAVPRTVQLYLQALRLSKLLYSRAVRATRRSRTSARTTVTNSQRYCTQYSRCQALTPSTPDLRLPLRCSRLHPSSPSRELVLRGISARCPPRPRAPIHRACPRDLVCIWSAHLSFDFRSAALARFNTTSHPIRYGMYNQAWS